MTIDNFQDDEEDHETITKFRQKIKNSKTIKNSKYLLKNLLISIDFSERFPYETLSTEIFLRAQVISIALQ